nr:hypothetical protein [Aestuariivivens sediminis]
MFRRLLSFYGHRGPIGNTTPYPFYWTESKISCPPIAGHDLKRKEQDGIEGYSEWASV